jgi:hypothetical protein
VRIQGLRCSCGLWAGIHGGVVVVGSPYWTGLVGGAPLHCAVRNEDIRWWSEVPSPGSPSLAYPLWEGEHLGGVPICCRLGCHHDGDRGV